MDDKLLPCPKCGMAVVVTADGAEHLCASCGAPLRLEPEAEPDVPSVWTSMRYPFSLAGFLFLATLAPVWGGVRALGTSLFFGLGEAILGAGGVFLGVVTLALFGGYLAVWLWDILENTATGSDAPPDIPWPGDYVEYGKSFLRFATAFATAFLPALLVRFGLGTEGWKGGLGAALALAGMAYYPMAMLLVGLSGNWLGGFGLREAVRAIRILGRDYALCCVFVGVSFGLTTAVELGAAAVWTRVGGWPALGASVLATFLELAVYASQMRAIGLVYRAHRKELGWF